ncbi:MULTISPECIES: hypothetical protein [Bradyrhizobium]|nr:MULTISPECIES: hypothetical protein [Bradyrhizobium]QOG20667.1 hypothetical protein FOM02_28255 [Bradyrhizobium sp. SEMIA]UFW46084.1 hypothetical protein BaraCB756_27650 [Bradyrhizobium arachidis]
MVMTADDILSHPAFESCVRGQAQAMLAIQEASPRTSSPFATQQRWLMSQAMLAAYFRNEAQQTDSGILPARLVDPIVAHGLASRNTASAFVNEMLKYGTVRHVAGSEGRRYRPIEPSPLALAVLSHWLAAHLTALDGLDGGNRSAELRERPALLGAIQPLIADGLLASRAVREPNGTFSLFTWIDDGGVVMDRLIVGCQQDSIALSRIPTDVTSVSRLAQGLNLSRSQLARKFVVAETMGSLGWSGARGKSALWVSAEFWREYHAAQAVKLAIIESAFEACRAYGAGDQARSVAASR